MTQHPAYRIEHQTAGEQRILGEADDWHASTTAMAPSAAKLLAVHARGELVLIETATGRAVDRRVLWPEPE